MKYPCPSQPAAHLTNKSLLSYTIDYFKLLHSNRWWKHLSVNTSESSFYVYKKNICLLMIERIQSKSYLICQELTWNKKKKRLKKKAQAAKQKWKRERDRDGEILWNRGVINMQPSSLVLYKGENAYVDQLIYSILTQCFLASWFSEVGYRLWFSGQHLHFYQFILLEFWLAYKSSESFLEFFES